MQSDLMLFLVRMASPPQNAQSSNMMSRGTVADTLTCSCDWGKYLVSEKGKCQPLITLKNQSTKTPCCAEAEMPPCKVSESHQSWVGIRHAWIYFSQNGSLPV
jgi:hypothetical protein